MKVLLLAALALAGAAVAGVVAHASASKSTIRITEREYRISVSTTKGQTGRVRFEVKNAGKYPHELAISGPGVKAKTKLIKPGKSDVLLVDLKNGAYAIWCTVPGHAAKGMKAALTVGALTVGAPTTSGGGGDGGAQTTPGDGMTTDADAIPWG